MKEKNIDEEKYVSIWIPIGVLIAICCLFGSVIWYTLTDDTYEQEYIIIEGVVTDVIPVLREDGSIDYFHVSFDTGEQYRIVHHGDLDLTVNSKFIFELYHYPNSGEDYKYIKQIVKIP